MESTKALGMTENCKANIYRKGLCCREWQINIIIISYVCVVFEQRKTDFHFVNEKKPGTRKVV